MRRSFTSISTFHYAVACVWLTSVLVITQGRSLAQAQVPKGKQYTSTMNDLNERTRIEVDPSTLAMNVSISLADFAGRGVSLPVTLRYASKIWGVKYNTTNLNNGQISEYVLGAEWFKNSRGGWTSSLNVPMVEFTGDNEPFIARYTPIGRDILFPDDGRSWDYSSQPQIEGNSTPLQYFANRAILHLPDGSSHEMRQDDLVYSGNPGPWNRMYYAVDGSRIKYDPVTQVVFLPDGSRYLLNTVEGAQYIDRNGNTLNYNSNFGHWTDTLGRVISNPLAGSGDYYWNVPTAQGAIVTYIFRWRSLSQVLTNSSQPLRYVGSVTSNNPPTQYPFVIPISPSLFNETSTGLNSPYGFVISPRYINNQPELFNPTLLSEIELPGGQGRKYRFTYNVWGEIDKIYLPTGGYRRYQYDFVPATDHDNESRAYAQANRGVEEAWESVTGNQQDETPVTWRFQPNTGGGGVLPHTISTNPDGTYVHRYIAYRDALNNKFNASPGEAGVGRIYDERHYTATGQMLRRVLTKWIVTGPQQLPFNPQAYQPAGMEWTSRDVRVERQVEILLDTGTSNALAKATEYQYDNDLNVISTKYYDYATIDNTAGQSVPIHQIPNGTLLRTEETTYLVNDLDIPQATRNNYRSLNLIALPSKMVVKNGSTIVAATQYKYDEGAYPLTTYNAVSSWIDPQTLVRGNVTTIRHWQDYNYITGIRDGWPGWTSGTWIETHNWYDQCGNVVKIRDANGYDTTTSYEDNFYNYSAQNTYAYPTSVTTPGPALITTTKYDFNTGLAMEVTDPNIVRTRNEYNDPFNRLTKTIRAEGTSAQNQTVIQYQDTQRRIITISDKDAAGESNSGIGLRSVVFYDGYGRTTRSAVDEGNHNWSVKDTIYDVLHRVSQISNPYRIAAFNVSDIPSVANAASKVWTTPAYDALSRIVSITTPDNAVVTTTYKGAKVLVTDQDNKRRVSQRNALGLLTNIWEITAPDPAAVDVDFPGLPTGTKGYLTSYSYDVLDNLVYTTQYNAPTGTTQTRSFVYDSLKRLVTATNPESGLIRYRYDANGNLKRKTDALQVYVEIDYDALNRAKKKTYSDGTPTVDYFYDTQLPTGAPSLAPEGLGKSKGRLVAVTYGPTGATAGSYYYGYDELGRITRSLQQTAGTDYKLGYAYNRASHLTSQTYPSGRTVLTNYDTAGRIREVKLPGTYWSYASQFSYAPHGAVKDVKLGNGLWEQMLFNTRLQVTQIGVGPGVTPGDTSKLRLDYNYGPSATNNGNLRSQTITLPGLSLTQTYTYDDLNRLKTASEGSWSQTYGYDRFGNRWVTGYIPTPGLTPQSQAAYELTTNRLWGSSHYNAAGNQTSDPTGRMFGYDAENRLISSTANNLIFSYDGEGRRVKKVSSTVNGSVTAVFVYNAQGQMVAEYTSTAPAYASGGTKYLTTDHLGSTRLVTSSARADVKARYDYLPFGEELGASISSGRATTMGYSSAETVRQKFTSKERDAETGLDYFMARYYSAVQGRFTSPDEFTGGPDELYDFTDMASENPLFYADLTEPQSLNKYQYTYNNPLRYTDPNGHCPECFPIALQGARAGSLGGPIGILAGAALAVIVEKTIGWDKVGNKVENTIRKVASSGYSCGSFEECGSLQAMKSQANSQDSSGKGSGNSQSNSASNQSNNKNQGKNNQDDKDQNERKQQGPVFKTNKEAQAKAEEMGFTKIKATSNGQAVFQRGKLFITRDVDGHNGGAWKAAESVKALGKKTTRLGTYDADLKRIGD
jgi:RHS repeat-associated protein